MPLGVKKDMQHTKSMTPCPVTRATVLAHTPTSETTKSLPTLVSKHHRSLASPSSTPSRYSSTAEAVSNMLLTTKATLFILVLDNLGNANTVPLKIRSQRSHLKFPSSSEHSNT